jgi:MFS transporter, FSR family, fosmidomycin resistance protein
MGTTVRPSVDPVPTDPQTSQAGRRGLVVPVGTLALAHTVNDSYAYVLPALLPAIIPSLGLTLGLAGVLVSFYQVTSSLVQPLVGHLADRGRLRWPAWAGVAASGLGAGLLGLAPNYLAVMGLLLLGGVGTAIFHPVAGAIVGAAAPEQRRGRWLGFFVTAGNIGNFVGPLALGYLLNTYGVAGTWPIALPALLMAGLVALLAPRRSGPQKLVPPLLKILRQHRRMLGALILVVAFRSWISTALLTFLPLLGRERGLGLGDAAQTITAYLAAGALGGLVGGFAADRWGRDRVIIGAMLAMVPFGLLLGLRPAVDLSFFAAAACAGFFLNASLVVLTIRGQESVPGSVGMVTGIMLGLSIGLGGLAIAPVALLAEWIGLSAATAMVASTGLAGALAMRLVPPVPGRGAGDRVPRP